jgi:hypothetical protein
MGKLLIVATTDWAIDSVLGNLAWAIAFSRTAEAATRADKRVSAIKVAIAKRTITAALSQASETEQRKLVTAYSRVVSTQIYDEARRGGKVFLGRNALDALQIPKHAIIITSDSDEGYVTFRMPFAGVHIRLGHQFMIFERLEFLGPAPPLNATLLAVTQPSKILVKNCIIRNYNQNLDGISWFDVTFEACEITTTLHDVLLLNVAFKDCSLNVPQSAFFPLSASAKLTASGITYSSEAQSLVEPDKGRR